jgi:hypothetical protein
MRGTSYFLILWKSVRVDDGSYETMERLESFGMYCNDYHNIKSVSESE